MVMMWKDCWIPTKGLMATWMAVALMLMTLATPSTYGLVLEGSHTSYAQFRQWHGGHNDSLTFEFSTNQSDALLLYSDNNQEKEYLQIKLVDGNVMLRYVLLLFYATFLGLGGTVSKLVGTRETKSFYPSKIMSKYLIFFSIKCQKEGVKKIMQSRFLNPNRKAFLQTLVGRNPNRL